MAKKAYIGVDGKARKVKKGYVGIPYTYTEVDHIQSDGSAWTDSGVYPTQNTKIEVEVTTLNGNFYSSINATSRYAMYVINDGSIDAAFGASGYLGDTVTGLSLPIVATLENGKVTANGKTYTFATQSAFTSPYTLPLFAQNANGTVSPVKGGCHKYKVYENGTLIRDMVSAVRNDGAIGMYDKLTGEFRGNKGSGSFTAGTATGTVYTGKGVARKIKKAYIGVGGVARPCWSGGEVAYYGTITPLTENRFALASTSNGNHALFGGGLQGSVQRPTVEAYDKQLVKKQLTGFTQAKAYHAAASVGGYMLFGGGLKSDGSTNLVEPYNSSLVRQTYSSIKNSAYNLAATTLSGYAIFGGGRITTSKLASEVTALNSSLSKTYPTALSVARESLAATTVGDYALFGGGHSTSNLNTMDAYNSSLTRSTPSNQLSEPRYGLAATTVGNYALFGGGAVVSSVVDAYDKSLTRTIAPELTVARYSTTATTVGGFALFGGGENPLYSGGTYVDVVDVYDTSLTRTTTTKLNKGRSMLTATTVGNYALFGGGYINGDKYTDIVDAYTVA